MNSTDLHRGDMSQQLSLFKRELRQRLSENGVPLVSADFRRDCVGAPIWGVTIALPEFGEYTCVIPFTVNNDPCSEDTLEALAGTILVSVNEKLAAKRQSASAASVLRKSSETEVADVMQEGQRAGVLRVWVPAGWLVIYQVRGGVCFVPDPTHEWKLKEQENHGQ